MAHLDTGVRMSPESPGAALAAGGSAFQILFVRSATPMLVADDDRRFRDANSAATALLGLGREHLLSLRIDDLSPPGGQTAVLDEQWRSFLAAGTQHGRWELSLPGGRRMTVSYSAVASVVPGLHLSMFPVPGDETPELDLLNGPAADPDFSGGPGSLTPREREVMSLLALGCTGEQIARQLVISPETVRNHTRNARAKLGANTRAHAIARALGRGELDLTLTARC